MIAYNCVYPPRWNDHGVSLSQLHFEDFVNHISKPCIVLELSSRPLFVCRQVGWRWSYEVEDFGTAENVIINGRTGKVDMPVLSQID